MAAAEKRYTIYNQKARRLYIGGGLFGYIQQALLEQGNVRQSLWIPLHYHFSYQRNLPQMIITMFNHTFNVSQVASILFFHKWLV